MATNLTLKQEITLGDLEDKPDNYRLKQRQIKREILKMKLKIQDYEKSIALLDDEILEAEKQYADYKSSLK